MFSEDGEFWEGEYLDGMVGPEFDESGFKRDESHLSDQPIPFSRPVPLTVSAQILGRSETCFRRDSESSNQSSSALTSFH